MSVEYETTLRCRLEVLKDQLAEGKVHFASHLAEDAKQSLIAVRYNNDGEIDLDTVDGRVRSLALAVASMIWREDAKKTISIQDAQSQYFDAIEHTFGEIKELAKGTDLTPDQIAEGLSRDDTMVKQGVEISKEFVPQLEQFWKDVHDPVSYNLTDLDSIKGVFGGDLFPLGSKSLASTCGLYLDTIILTDPFMNSKVPFERWPEKNVAKYFFKHGLNVLKYRDLALAETDVPIVALLPFESAINSDHADFVAEASEPDMLAHARILFNEELQSLDELRSFCDEIIDVDDLSKRLNDPDRLLFDTCWSGSIEEQIGRALAEFDLFGLPATTGNLILMQCVGRMIQANDVLIKSSRLRGSPLIEAPTSWKYFNWMLEYGAEQAKDSAVPLHMSHGLQYAGSSDVPWLGNVPHEALIEMRKRDALPEIRSMLQEGVEEIASTNPSGFFRTADQIVDNIDRAYSQHLSNLEDLQNKKWEFLKHDIGSWMVTGSIGVAAALFGEPTFALGALAADQTLDAPKLREIPKKFVEVRQGKKHLATSPMGLLFSHSE